MILQNATHLVFYCRVSRRSQSVNIEKQKQNAREFIDRLPDSQKANLEITWLEEIARHHELEKRSKLQNALELSKQPGTCIVLLPSNSSGSGDHPITRLTRDPELIRKYLADGCKIFNGMSPDETPEDLIREVKKARRVEVKKQGAIKKSKRKPLSEGQRLARLKGGEGNRLKCENEWLPLIGNIKFARGFAKTYRGTARLLNSLGITTPQGKQFTAVQIKRLADRGALKSKRSKKKVRKITLSSI